MSTVNLEIFSLPREIEGVAGPIPSHLITPVLEEERQRYLPSPRVGVGVGVGLKKTDWACLHQTMEKE